MKHAANRLWWSIDRLCIPVLLMLNASLRAPEISKTSIVANTHPAVLTAASQLRISISNSVGSSAFCFGVFERHRFPADHRDRWLPHELYGHRGGMLADH